MGFTAFWGLYAVATVAAVGLRYITVIQIDHLLDGNGCPVLPKTVVNTPVSRAARMAFSSFVSRC